MDSSLLPPTGELPTSVLFLSNANASHRHSAGGELSVRYMGIYGSSRCVFKARHKRAAALFFGLGLLRCIVSFLAFVITDGGWIVFFFLLLSNICMEEVAPVSGIDLKFVPMVQPNLDLCRGLIVDKVTSQPGQEVLC